MLYIDVERQREAGRETEELLVGADLVKGADTV